MTEHGRFLPVWFIQTRDELDGETSIWYSEQRHNRSTDLVDTAILGFGIRPTGQTITGGEDFDAFKAHVENVCRDWYWLSEPWRRR